MDDWVYENLNIAEAASKKGLCDHCLGRMFGKLGTGMTNLQRASMIKEALLEKDITANVPDECSLCGNIFDLLDRFADAASEKLMTVETENFLIGSRVDPEIEKNETKLWNDLGAENAEPLRSELNREIGKLVFSKIQRDVEFKNPQAVACVDTRFADVTLDVAPVFIYGRYNKLSREIPQTIWPCRVCRGKGCRRCNNIGKMYATSVQEIIGDIAADMCNAKEHSFHGMGREDIDALMLGTGRPFVLEISDPVTRTIDLAELERRANMSELAKFNSLAFVSRDAVRAMKDSAATKTYLARVKADNKINKERVNEVARSFKDLCIDQRTPARVEHRRADLVRRRKILWVKADRINNDTFDLTMETESGTYVKEFVSGDGGRSRPSFSEALGIQCRVEELDVLAINDHGVIR
ncbi:MAG: tRNA pseudouridine(54/55) synthase Pus10 [Methanomassiliicoccaceae archaeon]|nr:tRNA pseudouridine(54/55) synthase Pus10 [Methanomassiliicoccaceae archaeon]